MRFFEAAANWADRKAVDVKFARDEYDGWFAILSFSDQRGPFSAIVNAVEPTPVRDPDFQARIDKMMDKATVDARRRRIKSVRFAKAA